MSLDNKEIDYFEEYDRYIGLEKFSDKSLLYKYKKRILNNLQKERPILKDDYDNYNKFTLFHLVEQGKFNNKKKAIHAIKFGKTKDYISLFSDDVNFRKLIKNIYVKLEIGKKEKNDKKNM